MSYLDHLETTFSHCSPPYRYATTDQVAHKVKRTFVDGTSVADEFLLDSSRSSTARQLRDVLCATELAHDFYLLAS